MNAPRILHIGKFYWPYQRGIETHLRLLCESINEHYDLHVLVANTRLHTSHETINGVEVTRLARLAAIASTQICPTLISHLRTYRPDITHIHLPNPWAEWAYFLAGKPGKLVVSFHSDIIRQKRLLTLHSPIHTRFLAHAERIIVASPNHWKYSPFLSSLPQEKCAVIPYGIHADDFRATPEILQRAGELRHTYGTPLILFVGQLVYYKGIDILIDAAKWCDAHVLIIGDGPLRNTFKKQVEVKGLTHKVSFAGHVDMPTLRAAYHAADVFCLPSTQRSEAFGIVQLEAFAAGTPVVSTDLPSGVPWVNRHQYTGLIVPPGDPRALAEALNSLVQNDHVRTQYGAQAADYVRDTFTVAHMADATRALYADILR